MRSGLWYYTKEVYGTMSTLGLQVKEYRLAAGLTQVDLAKLAGISQPHVAQVENGEKRLTGRIAQKLAEAGLDDALIDLGIRSDLKAAVLRYPQLSGLLGQSGK